VTSPIRSVEIAVSGVPAPTWKSRVASFCGKALRAAEYRSWEISLLLCDDARITALNAKYRGKNTPTDVLSFPWNEEDAPGFVSDPKERRVSGDIAISLPAMRRNAALFGATENEELKRLLIHGILHVAGMDHGKGRSGPMLDLQEKLTEQLRGELVITE
jgi:probable rRNA maturation factor